jgi:hypothetical protein
MEKELMQTNNMKLETFKLRFAWGFASTVLLLLLIGVLLLVVGYAGSSFAQDSQPKTFSSPEEAANALFEAAQREDEPALEAILGAGKEVTSSSDEVEDKLEREQFASKYREMHRLVREPDGSTVLYIGAENWPFPIPLVATNAKWQFDSESGSKEIRAREIGENEIVAIEVCQAVGKANGPNVENTSAEDDVVLGFARKLHETGNSKSATSEAFYGYYFRVSKQEAGATLVVAYPAEYRSSGVMTFVLSGDTVFQKDLGPQTVTTAEKIQGKPSGRWSRVH